VLAEQCSPSVYQYYTEQPGVYDSGTFTETFDETGIVVVSKPDKIQTNSTNGILCRTPATSTPCRKVERTFFLPNATPEGYQVNQALFSFRFECSPGQVLKTVEEDYNGKQYKTTFTCELFTEFGTVAILTEDFQPPTRSIRFTSTFREFTIRRVIYFSTTCRFTSQPSAAPTDVSGSMSMSKSKSMSKSMSKSKSMSMSASVSASASASASKSMSKSMGGEKEKMSVGGRRR
jgi:hypothetical protein